MSDAKDDFEEQLQQEKIQQANAQDDALGKARTRVDADGTVFEWDTEKKAWFPKIDSDFIAQYQMSYGSGTNVTADSGVTPATANKTAPSPSDPNYEQWYKYYYDNIDTSSKEYKEWYEYYYGSKQPSETGAGKADSTMPSSQSKNKKVLEMEETEGTEDEQGGRSREEDEEYWKQYYEYYQSQGMEAPEPSEIPQTTGDKDETLEGGKTEAKPTQKPKKGEKRKAEPPSWFNVEEDKNTNVYVFGLPPDTTEDEFKELMNKCGLVMYDPRTRKLKLKLYKNPDGELKGDGLCCYIKPESVDLALQILDGYDVRGYKINVERAKFEMKGSFDPGKRKKKLSNKEKKKFQEKQAKLFDWRPDKVTTGRPRHERVLIIKNVFDPKDFEKDPAQINEIRTDLRQECSKYGDVKKVQVYDRHPEGVVGVTFSEPEEADVCLEAITGRWFAGRQLVGESWDGRTKFDIVETETEREKRLKQWEDYLEGKTENEAQEGAPAAKTTSQENMDVDAALGLGKGGEGKLKGQSSDSEQETGDQKEGAVEEKLEDALV